MDETLIPSKWFEYLYSSNEINMSGCKSFDNHVALTIYDKDKEIVWILNKERLNQLIEMLKQLRSSLA